MARAEANNGLLEGILCSSRRVMLLHGPAACGKTAVAMAFHRRFQDDSGQSRCLLLAPNAPAADQLRRRLLAESPGGVIVSPQVQTFAALAGRVLAEAGDTGRMLSPLQRRLLLRRIVDQLLAEGRLGPLTAVADTPGLISALDRAIAELKRAAIEPEAMSDVIPKTPDKRRDLLEVYRRYQQHLREGGSYDVEGLMWQARVLLADAESARKIQLAGVDALAVDGFTDFTPTQLAILALLSRRVRRMLITLPCRQDGRERLWHWAARTLNSVRRTFGADLEELAVPPEAAERSALGGLLDRLFAMEPSPCPIPTGLSVIAAAGMEAEVEAAARRIKRLLLEGAPAGSIAVLARSLEAYRRPIQRVFAEHDLPVAEAAAPLTETPIVRFALAAASLGPKFAFRDVLGVIKNSYFRPPALGPYDARTVAVAEMLIRQGNVLEGRDEYRAAATRLAYRPVGGDEDETELGPLQASAAELNGAADMLQRLFDLAQPARDDSTGDREEAPDDACRFRAIIDSLQLIDAACAHEDPAIVARDLRALTALQEALRQLPDAAMPPQRLAEALGEMPCPPARGESLVDVLDVLDARALRYDHVFLLGISDGQFPRPHVESTLLGEADRLAWASRGLVMDSRRDLAAREMFLFYLAASRAGKTLTLGYLHADASGKPSAPSGFLTSLLAPCGGLEALEQARRVEMIWPGQVLPPAQDVATPRQAMLAAMTGLWGDGQIDPSGPLAWSVEHNRGALFLAAMGLWARHRRWQGGPCNEFDGRITDPALLEELNRRFPGQTVFSATQFDTFNLCPWQFFAAYVLKLQPLQEPQRRLEPVARGIFCHNVLCRLMRLLKSQAGPDKGVRLAELDEPAILAALDQSVQAEAASVESRRPPYPALWSIQKQQMRRQLADYLRLLKQNDAMQAECLHFELGFGLEGEESPDPAATAEPIRLDTPAGEVRIRGKIDRVDRVVLDGQSGLFVVDYKTGSLPSRADIAAGRNLQLAIYTEAAEKLLGKPALGGAFHQIGPADRLRERHFGGVQKQRGGYSLNGDLEAMRREAREQIGQTVTAMREGRFDLLPSRTCVRYCPFRRICHFAPARGELKGAAQQEGVDD